MEQAAAAAAIQAGVNRARPALPELSPTSPNGEPDHLSPALCRRAREEGDRTEPPDGGGEPTSGRRSSIAGSRRSPAWKPAPTCGHGGPAAPQLPRHPGTGVRRWTVWAATGQQPTERACNYVRAEGLEPSTSGLRVRAGLRSMVPQGSDFTELCRAPASHESHVCHRCATTFPAVAPIPSTTDPDGRQTATSCSAGPSLQLQRERCSALDAIDEAVQDSPRRFFARVRAGLLSCFTVASNAASIMRGFASCSAW